MAATAAASEYYSTVEAVMHVDRQRLYGALGLAYVGSTAAERQRNERLSKMLTKEWPRQGRVKVSVPYARGDGAAEPARQRLSPP